MPALLHYLPLAGDFRSAGFKVQYCRREKGTTPRNPMVCLLLDMDRLGAIRADFLLIENDLSVTVYVQTPSLKDLVERSADEIRSSLGQGVDHLNFKVLVSASKIESFGRPQGTRTGNGRVDVMA
jgi:hypothetical protein